MWIIEVEGFQDTSPIISLASTFETPSSALTFSENCTHQRDASGKRSSQTNQSAWTQPWNCRISTRMQSTSYDKSIRSSFPTLRFLLSSELPSPQPRIHSRPRAALVALSLFSVRHRTTCARRDRKDAFLATRGSVLFLTREPFEELWIFLV